MALAVDSQMPSTAGLYVASQTSPWTWSFNNVAGNALYVAFGVNAATPTVTASYNSASMTLVGSISDSGNGFKIHLFRLASPSTGSNTVSITFSAGSTVTAGAISFSGAAATPDSGTSATNQWSGVTTLTWPVTVNSTTNGNIVLQTTCYGDTQGSWTFSDTETWAKDGDSGSVGNSTVAQYKATAGGNVTLTTQGTLVQTSFYTLGIEVLAAAGGATSHLLTTLGAGS